MKKTLLWISFILLLGVNICLFYFLLSKKGYLVEVFLSKLRGGGMDGNIALQIVGEDCKARPEYILFMDEGGTIDEKILFELNQYLIKILTYLGIETESKEEGGFRFLSPIDKYIALPLANNCWVAAVQANDQIVMGYEKKNGKMVKLLIKNLPSELLRSYEEF